MIIRLLGMLFSLVSCLSCTQSSRSMRYINWVQDFENGLHVKEITNEFIFDLQYLPSEYLRLMKNESIDSYHESLNGFQQYQLSITLKDNSNLLTYRCHNEEDIQNKLYYFSYRFQNDIHLEENGKEIPCVLYHFERSLDLANSRTFLLGFENPDSLSTEAQLVIQSDQFSEKPIKIKISKNRPSYIL